MEVWVDVKTFLYDSPLYFVCMHVMWMSVLTQPIITVFPDDPMIFITIYLTYFSDDKTTLSLPTL